MPIHRYIRTYMSQHALPLISNLRDDDLFLNFDADEVPKEEVLFDCHFKASNDVMFRFQVIQFLRLYNGYPEPIEFTFRWTVYGYFWQKTRGSAIASNEREFLS